MIYSIRNISLVLFFGAAAAAQGQFSPPVAALGAARPTTGSEALGQSVAEELGWRAGQFGKAPGDAAESLQEHIYEAYGHRVECAAGWLGLGGISEAACLSGIRQLLAALAKMGSGAANPELLGINKITLSRPGAWGIEGGRWDELDVRVPFDAPAEKIADYLYYGLRQVNRASDRVFLANLEAGVLAARERFGFAIEVDPGLSPMQVARGMWILKDSVAAMRSLPGGARREPLFDVLYLAKSNGPLAESHLKMRAPLDIDQSDASALVRVGSFFAVCKGPATGPSGSAEALENCEDTVSTRAARAFRAQRLELEKAMASLNGIVGSCGNLSEDLAVASCLAGVKSFVAAQAMLPPAVAARMARLEIAGGGPPAVVLSASILDVTRVEGDRARFGVRVNFASEPRDIAEVLHRRLEGKALVAAPGGGKGAGKGGEQ